MILYRYLFFMKKYVSVRTNNLSLEKVSDLWEEFMSSIYKSSNDFVYGIYTNYDLDEKWDYDLILTQDKSIFNFENREYEEYKVTWEFPLWVYETWQKIWNDKNLERKFDFDYELYDFSSWNPECTIFISKK